MVNAVLNSNSGDDAIEISLVGAIEIDGQSGYEVSLRLKGTHWDGGDSHELAVSVEGLAISDHALRGLADKLSEWLELPLKAMATTPLVGEHRLALAPHQTLNVHFGDRADVIAGFNQVVSVRLDVRTFKGDFFFVSDQSCFRIFHEGLTAALGDGAG